MIRILYKLGFSFFSLLTLAQAQELKEVSKSEILNQTLENNRSIKISIEAFNEAKGEYKQTNAVFLPNISVSHSGFATTNPLMAFGSKLNQEILTQADFNPDVLNNPDQTQNFATTFEFQQPLINMDGFYQRKAAKNKMEAMSLQSNRIKDYMAFEVNKAYMQLQLAYKAVEVFERALQAAEANFKLANDSYNQGLLQRADVLQVEVRVSELKNQLQSAKSNIKNASNYLSFLMNERSDIVLKPKDSLQINVVSLSNEESLLSEERADIKAMALVAEAQKSIYNSDKMSFLPTLNAFGNYQLFDENLFQFGASGYLIGAELKWNILSGTKRFGKSKTSRATYEKSKLEYEQYLSQSQLELNKTKRLLEDAQNKVELTELALQQSEEALRIRTNRFKEGLEKTSDLLLVEALFAQKQLEYYQTVYEYNRTKAYLNYLTTL
ncbi:TolC family protein [Winogradskyella sp. DF17]|uniref:TolC family protein n=1 Tax=Winogradskyella pelagia TaxID=2819984 RepID=A0ABS3SZP0_9FLAO|nr:TolC family protein [Winogradskyella sp. DF17]MBO3115952.1 TolC family protein [Winogradskyella sp. DF17]